MAQPIAYPQIQARPQLPPTPAPTSFDTPSPSMDPALPVDYHLLLLSLAEDYIAAAHGMGSLVALHCRNADMEAYYKLIATGLGCMESVLKNWRLHPRMEAELRLRYAGLLHQETENSAQTESVLSKGITLCDRNRLLGLKYSMHHLLARVLFKTNPRAALKSLDNLIPDVEASEHTAWAYAFRFLRASLSLQVPSHPETLAALQHLRRISTLADSQGDRAIFVACSAVQAMVYLRSGSMDCIEQAQRAIAAARSYQLQMTAQELGHFVTLLDFIDLACCLQQYNPEQATVKMQAMQASMDRISDEMASTDDGSFSVLIEQSSGGQATTSTGGVFQKTADGRDMLTFTWLRKLDLYLLGYFLSGVTAHLKFSVGGKAEQYLQESLRMSRESFKLPESPGESFSTATDRARWKTLIEWHIYVHLALLSSYRADWASARAWLNKLHETRHKHGISEAESLDQWATYLHGVIDQASGNTVSALSVFQSPLLSLPDPAPNRSLSVQQDLAILAALNTILIIRDSAHPQHHQADTLLLKLEPLCLSHPNKAIEAGLYLVKATSTPGFHGEAPSIIKTKQYIHTALKVAKSVANQQLLAISMSFMTAMFFKDIVGEQAEKSAKAARHLARGAGSALWTCVTDGMLADTLAKHGKREEAAAALGEARELAAQLPGELGKRCGGGK
ncbi:hypothetical protein W97_00866 [Coniosporium apollinis CBS 100218]|uniref:Cohesin loading factor n=1 Tax=Coniosporium apollinis (strain CBS 100218) TaxID=1168221 RepID=R7YIC4_CONA1|nr:uncharacterized protein W97_00866 [Coniosporium apollinis CBS 100218]EON61650.1 hypothetical protein W97_00866 [Coniosporium apollinis CBS 100218]